MTNIRFLKENKKIEYCIPSVEMIYKNNVFRLKIESDKFYIPWMDREDDALWTETQAMRGAQERIEGTNKEDQILKVITDSFREYWKQVSGHERILPITEVDC